MKNNFDFDDLKIVWEDEFLQPSLDSSKWKKCIWAPGMVNNEVQSYVDDKETCITGNGLTINAIRTDNSWKSCRITTAGLYSWKYGYFEAEIKLPSGNGGIWPAFWMMSENGVYGKWPRSGEIDILEYSPSTFGNDVYGTIHYGTGIVDNENHFWKNLIRTQLDSVDKKFHKYGLLWTEDKIEFFYDRKSLGSVWERQGKSNVEWPYNQDFHIILNLAMGGTLGGKIPDDMSIAQMNVNYVRVYSIYDVVVSYTESDYNPPSSAGTYSVLKVAVEEAVLNPKLILPKDSIEVQKDGNAVTVEVSYDEILNFDASKLRAVSSSDNVSASFSGTTLSISGSAMGEAVVTISYDGIDSISEELTVNVVAELPAFSVNLNTAVGGAWIYIDVFWTDPANEISVSNNSISNILMNDIENNKYIGDASALTNGVRFGYEFKSADFQNGEHTLSFRIQTSAGKKYDFTVNFTGASGSNVDMTVNSTNFSEVE